MGTLEEEVSIITKSLYDLEVEKNGIQQGEKKKSIEIFKKV